MNKLIDKVDPMLVEMFTRYYPIILMSRQNLARAITMYQRATKMSHEHVRRYVLGDESTPDTDVRNNLQRWVFSYIMHRLKDHFKKKDKGMAFK